MANDFSGDANCISLYRFESGALTTDSKGSNTLTASGSPVADTNHQEGSYSALFVITEPKQFFYITDSALGSTFPLKSGTSNKTFTFCQWFRISGFSAGTDETIWARYSTAGSYKTALAHVVEATGIITLKLSVGDETGADSQTFDHATSLANGTWYHFTIGYRDSDKAYVIYVRDTSFNVVGSDINGTTTNNIALFSQSDWMIGCSETNASPATPFGGRLDEFVVFNRLLTGAEATSIAAGTYGGGPVTVGVSGSALTGGSGTGAPDFQIPL